MGSKLYVCQGSDCRKKKAEAKALAGLTENVQTVRCQKICKGLVVGCEVGGEVQWFARVNSSKHLRALKRLLSKGKLKKSLARRVVKKRAGKIR